MLPFASEFLLLILTGQVSCSEETERWCEIYPASTTLNISPGDSKVITCTIPSTPGTVNFCNQFGNPVTSLPNVDLYPPVIDDSDSCAQMSYRVNISWTVDKHIREQLKIVQCAASFEGISRPSWTSVVSINFLDSEKGMP